MENSIPFKDWRIVREIGRGSYGRVYEIERDFYGKTLKSAMKVIPIPTDEGALDNLYGSGFDEKSVSTWCRQRLNDILGEYSLMESLKGYTNIVGVEDVEVVERTDSPGYYVYIRMELLTSLQRRLREEDFTEEDVIKLGKDICQALVVCEQHKIIHRDIKPENIMVSEHGDYKLGDFGVARQLEHTMSATVAGTERYMAPEIIKREKYGRDVDTYSLGVVMYRLLNKRTMPFMKIGELPTAEDVSAAQARRLSGEPFPAPAEGSKELVRIVLKACSFDRAKRYSSAADMLSDLEALPVAKEEQIPPHMIYEPDPEKKPEPEPEPEADPADDETLPMMQDFAIGQDDTFSGEDETVAMVSSSGTGVEQTGKKLNEVSAKNSKASLILYIGSVAVILVWILRTLLTENYYCTSDTACLPVIAIGTFIFAAGMQHRNWIETFTGRMMTATGCILFIAIYGIEICSDWYIDWTDAWPLAPWAVSVLIYGIVWTVAKLRLPERTDPAWAAYSSKWRSPAFLIVVLIILAARAVFFATSVFGNSVLSLIPIILYILLIIGIVRRNKILLSITIGCLCIWVLFLGITTITNGGYMSGYLFLAFPQYPLLAALPVLLYEVLRGPGKKTHIRIAMILSLFTLYLGNMVASILAIMVDGGTFAYALQHTAQGILEAALYIMITLMICSRRKELSEQ